MRDFLENFERCNRLNHYWKFYHLSGDELRNIDLLLLLNFTNTFRNCTFRHAFSVPSRDFQRRFHSDSSNSTLLS